MAGDIRHVSFSQCQLLSASSQILQEKGTWQGAGAQLVKMEPSVTQPLGLAPR